MDAIFQSNQGPSEESPAYPYDSLESFQKEVNLLLGDNNYHYRECGKCGDMEKQENEFHYFYWPQCHETGYVSELYLCKECNK